MFIKKDTRKIPDILSDESDEREELHLGRRCARTSAQEAWFESFLLYLGARIESLRLEPLGT